MQRALFTAEEVRLASERRLKYQGTAKVSLDQIAFDPPLPRDLDPKNLKRIKEVFRKHRCRRFDIDNHVPAIISRRDLAAALQQAQVPARALMTNAAERLPTLRFSAGQLWGLHGRHRAQVASEVLPPLDRWWTVDLYLDGMTFIPFSARFLLFLDLADIGNDLKTSLIEEYANERRPTDGEIYRKIRQYEGEQNEPFRQRWFVRLSRSNQDRLEQLDKSKNRRLRQGFDRLLRIPGFWPNGMRVSMLHRLIATNCVEEILTYLEHIGEFWSSLVDANPLGMKRIDQDTVNTLQLMAPGQSRTDARTVKGFILSGQVFAGFSEIERRHIWSRMEGFKGIIPSLYTFFEDFKYLECCSQCVKRLLGAPNESVWNTMKHMFVVPEEIEEDCLIQTSESTVRHQRADNTERVDLGYRQIWLYAMRHYPLMPPDPKSDDDLLAKPNRAKADERAIYDMAELARRLGFHSPEIEQLLTESPDREIARAALLQARKPDRFRYDPQLFERFLNQFEECTSAATPHQPETTQELLADSSVNTRARCGMPRTGTHKQDSQLLFLDRLHIDEVPVAETITTFFVRRCVYFAFFGKPLSHARDPALGGNSPPRDSSPASSLFLTDHIAAIGPGTTPSESQPREQPEREQRELYRRQEQHEIQQTRLARGLQREEQRRERKNQERMRRARRTEEMAQQPMELDPRSAESTYQDMPNGERGPSGDNGFAMQATLPREPPQEEREEPQGRRARRDGEQHNLRRQQGPRRERGPDVLKRRRARRAQTHTRQSRPTGEGDQDPMEWERLSTEPSDQEMSDQGRLSPELPIEGPQEESIPFDSAAGLYLHSTHGPSVPEEADTYSHCTRISLEATPLERAFGDRPTVEGPSHDDDLEGQAQVGRPQPQSTEDEDRNSSSVGVPGGEQPDLDDYLDRLMRAQKEQEKLEERLERERLEEQCGLSHQVPVLEPSPRPLEKQNPASRAPDDQPAEVTHSKDTDVTQAIVAEPTQNRLPASRREGQPETSVENPELTASSTRDGAGNPPSQRPSVDAEPPTPANAPPLPPALVEVSFWSFERGELKQSDRLRVDPSDPSPVERIARKYSWKNYSLYDRNLQSLSPAQCYRAATIDGHNAIFLISEHDEQKLAAEGPLVKNRQLLSLVSRVLEPELKKRHSRSTSVTSEEL